VVAERNYGGDLVEAVIKAVRPTVRYIAVNATRAKHVRAEPISALYTLGRVHHVGTFPELENEMCLMTAHGYEGSGSPDRVDAAVWGLTELFPQMVQNKTRTVHIPNLGAGGWMN
jgi:phage terminase large subunit-like protein